MVTLSQAELVVRIESAVNGLLHADLGEEDFVLGIDLMIVSECVISSVFGRVEKNSFENFLV